MIDWDKPIREISSGFPAKLIFTKSGESCYPRVVAVERPGEPEAIKIVTENGAEGVNAPPEFENVPEQVTRWVIVFLAGDRWDIASDAHDTEGEARCHLGRFPKGKAVVVPVTFEVPQ